MSALSNFRWLWVYWRMRSSGKERPSFAEILATRRASKMNFMYLIFTRVRGIKTKRQYELFISNPVGGRVFEIFMARPVAPNKIVSVRQSSFVKSIVALRGPRLTAAIYHSVSCLPLPVGPNSNSVPAGPLVKKAPQFETKKNQFFA